MLAGNAKTYSQRKAQRHSSEEAGDADILRNLALGHGVGETKQQAEQETALIADILQEHYQSYHAYHRILLALVDIHKHVE